MQVRFYTHGLRSPAVCQFAIPVQVDEIAILLRGEIIHSKRDGALAVYWPKAKGGFFAVAPETESDTVRINQIILEKWCVFQDRGAR